MGNQCLVGGDRVGADQLLLHAESHSYLRHLYPRRALATGPHDRDSPELSSPDPARAHSVENRCGGNGCCAGVDVGDERCAHPQPRVAMLLSYFISRRQPTVNLAALAIAYALGLVASVVWLLPPVHLNSYWWIVTGAAMVLSLVMMPWLVRQVRSIDSSRLVTAYSTAADYWAAGLAVVSGGALLATACWVYYGYQPASWLLVLGSSVLASGLLAKALITRISGKSGPAETLALALTVELVGAHTIPVFGGGTEQLAILNLALGLALQLGGEVWVRRSPTRTVWGIGSVPVAYAVWGFVLSLLTFTVVSPLYTVGGCVGAAGGRSPITREWGIDIEWGIDDDRIAGANGCQPIRRWSSRCYKLRGIDWGWVGGVGGNGDRRCLGVCTATRGLWSLTYGSRWARFRDWVFATAAWVGC